MGVAVLFAIASLLGVEAKTIPLFVVMMAVRIMRHPSRTQEYGRETIGLIAITLAIIALIHTAMDIPTPGDGVAALQGAGGVLGYVCVARLVAGAHYALSVPITLCAVYLG